MVTMNDRDYAIDACDGLLTRLDSLLVTLQELGQRRDDQSGPMPDVWRNRALPNLRRLRADALLARQAAERGELRPTVEICAELSGLRRDLDWTCDWMGPSARLAFETQCEALVLWAARHHREGYARLPPASP